MKTTTGYEMVAGEAGGTRMQSVHGTWFVYQGLDTLVYMGESGVEACEAYDRALDEDERG